MLNPSNARLLAIFCVVLATIALLLAVSFNAAQEKNVKTVPIKFTDPSSAKEMYTEYCAVCHGTEAKGNGPAASEFKYAPTDLTTLARKNNGKFPEDQVYATLKFGTNAPAHGTPADAYLGRPVPLGRYAVQRHPTVAHAQLG